MTEKNIKQIKEQLPKDEVFECAYNTYKGTYCAVSVDKKKNKHRYEIIFDKAFNATIKPM